MTRTNGASAGGGQQAAGKLPRKRFYRARAHSNPLSDSHFPVPVSPEEFDLSQHYPRYFPADKGGGEAAASPRIRFADVGCGFGGLLVGLSPLFPDKLMIGMELRDKVIMILFLLPSLFVWIIGAVEL
jgi:tRNA (guanine-N7-)-methyltransferase